MVENNVNPVCRWILSYGWFDMMMLLPGTNAGTCGFGALAGRIRLTDEKTEGCISMRPEMALRET